MLLPTSDCSGDARRRFGPGFAGRPKAFPILADSGTLDVRTHNAISSGQAHLAWISRDMKHLVLVISLFASAAAVAQTPQWPPSAAIDWYAHQPWIVGS